MLKMVLVNIHELPCLIRHVLDPYMLRTDAADVANVVTGL